MPGLGEVFNLRIFNLHHLKIPKIKNKYNIIDLSENLKKSDICINIKKEPETGEIFAWSQDHTAWSHGTQGVQS